MLPTVTVFLFFGCLYQLSRFNKYSRRLSNTWGMDEEERESLERRAKGALQMAGMLFAVMTLGVVLCIVMPSG